LHVHDANSSYEKIKWSSVLFHLRYYIPYIWCETLVKCTTRISEFGPNILGLQKN
jgi:hypothetical protein